MADQRRSASDDRDDRDIPGPGAEEIRDEKDEEDDEGFDDDEDPDDEEEDDIDLGKNVLDQERGAAASRRFTDEIGSEGGSQGRLAVQREHRRRRTDAGEAATTGGQPSDSLRFDRRRDG